MIRVLAIDPGTRDTGVVLMDEKGISCAQTIHFNDACGNDCHAVAFRARQLRDRLAPIVTLWKHDVIVMESWTSFSEKTGRANSATWQTPYAIGYLQCLVEELDGKDMVPQTSTEVFGVRRVKSFCYGAHSQDEVEAMKRAAAKKIQGGQKLTNEHLRSAALHGLYYLKYHKEQENLRLWN